MRNATLAHPGIRLAAEAWPGLRAAGFFLPALGLAMATGTFVVREPAPFDFAITLLGVAGLACGAMRFAPVHRILFVLLGAYLSLNIGCLELSQDMDIARGYLLISLYLVLSCVFLNGFLNHFGNAGWTALLNGYAVSGVVASVAAALGYWNILPWREDLLLAGRAKGWFKDPNVFGPYLVIVLLYSIVRLQRSRRPLSSLYWAAVLACAVLGVCLAFSRACWIGCAVALVAYFGLRVAHAWRAGVVNARLFYVLGCTAVVVAGAAGVLVTNTSTRRMLQLRLGQGGLQNYDDVRFYTQHRALEAGLRKPLGLGPGQSEVAFGYAPHNMYLRVLSENGAPGFILLYGVVLIGLGRAVLISSRSREPLAADLYAFAGACMAGILVNGLVIDVIHWRHFWLVIALTWSSPQQESETYAAGMYSYARG